METLDLGVVINTHGVRGEIKVKSFNDCPERFQEVKKVYIEDKGTLNRYNIKAARVHKGMAIVKLEGINSMNDALLLKGKILKIDEKDKVVLPEDYNFVHDLIGCEVYDVHTNELYGILEDVYETGSNDVYIIKRANKKELCIPALKKIVISVDVEAKLIKVDLPDGLLEIYE